MKNYHKYICMIATGVLLFSCSSDDPEGIIPGQENGSLPISFNASHNNTLSLSRAIGAFPNNGRIGVVAAPNNGNSIDWTSYGYIIDAPATANEQADGSYTFTWDQMKYWPFDGSRLSFLAYSPVASESGQVTLGADRHTLELTLIEDMPDVLYASGNTLVPIKAYSKDPLQTVDLGEFLHALSQLTVNVKPDAEVNSSLKIAALSVTSAKTQAIFDLTIGGNAGFRYFLNDQELNIPFVTTPVDIGNASTLSRTVLVYPGLEEYTYVNITLQDGPYSLERSYAVSDFTNTTTTGSRLSLDSGKNTTVNIIITGTTVQDPNSLITLEGTLTDWLDKGGFGVNIN